MTKELYEEIRAAWKRVPDAHAIARDVQLPLYIVETVIRDGLPELQLPPLIPPRRKDRKKRKKGKEPNPTRREMVHAALGLRATEEAEEIAAEVKQEIEAYEQHAEKLMQQIERMRAKGVQESALEQLRESFNRVLVVERSLATMKREALAADQLKRSAEEAAASRMTLRSAASVASITAHLTERVLQGLENGSVLLPDKLDVKTIMMLARAADTAASAVERALAIERRRLGKPEAILGVQLGAMLEGCSDAELEEISKRGRPLARMLSAGPRIVDAVGTSDDGRDGTEPEG